MSDQKKKNPSLRIDRLLSLIALVLITAAWFWGRTRSEINLMPFLHSTYPEAGHFEHMGSSIYSVWHSKKKVQLLGYLAPGRGAGFGGDLILMVAVSPKGEVLNAAVAAHKETPSFFRRVLKSDLIPSICGKFYNDPLQIKKDIDGISGATYTCEALAEAVRRASRQVAKKALGLSVPEEEKPALKFGFAEIFLILLFLLAFLTTRPFFKLKRISRWIILIFGLVILGFALNKPVNLIFVNRILLGFFPSWQSHIYWYLLLAGIFFFLIIDNKNLYCERMCPFGAAQECIGAIGGAKTPPPPPKARTFFRWVQRGLALIVIIIALIFTNPSYFSYEISGALFHLIGTSLQFAILGIILILSLFVRRPWCNYLCPVRPVLDIIRLFRSWAKEMWQKIGSKSPNTM
jgi:hypothetical protein